MKIFLDDFRQPEDCFDYMQKRIGDLSSIYLTHWVIVRNYHEFVYIIKSHINDITHVSFDHDLSSEHYHPSMSNDSNVKYNELYSQFKEKTGYDCAKWMKNYYESFQKKLPIIFVHSMNPIGTANILNLFNHE